MTQTKNTKARRNATKQKDRQGKTEHKQDAGQRVDRRANIITPNSRIKNQGLADEQQGKTENRTNNQTTRASNTRKLTTHKAQTANKPQAKSKTPAGERGTSRSTNGRKKIPTPPLLPTSHPPDPRRSREGRAINKRGVGGILFQKNQKQEEGGRDRQKWATPPVRLGLSGKIPERPRKRSQSVSWNFPREYGWDAPNPIIQGI